MTKPHLHSKKQYETNFLLMKYFMAHKRSGFVYCFCLLQDEIMYSNESLKD